MIEEVDAYFQKISQEILDSEIFQSEKRYLAHSNISVYEHSYNVAKRAYNLAKKKNLDIDYRSLIRGALLHDFYLYDWHKKGEGHRLHGFRHPFIAYKNATKYFKINKIEGNIIKSHMFPLVFWVLPLSKEARLVIKSDRNEAIKETFSKKGKGAFMKKIGLIFDVDGTLWDARKEVADSWSEVATSKGYKAITLDDLSKTMGLPMTSIADILFPDLKEKERYALLNECTENELVYLKKHCPKLYDQEIETLKCLKEAGFDLAILSNAQVGYIETFFDATNTSSLFIDHACWGDNQKCKSENMLILKERNHLDEIYYIGDTAMDEEESAKANAKFIHASYGFGKAKHPFFVLKQFLDLLEAVKLINR